MSLSKKDLREYFESIELSGLIIDRNITGQAVARKFGISGMEGRQAVDSYLRGELN